MRKGWVETSLGEVAEVLDRLRKPISGPEREKRLGEVPYYGATGRTGWIDEALFNEELVLLGEDAVDFLNPDVHKAYLIDGPSWVNNHAHVLRPNAEKVSGFFLMESLNAVDYSQFVAFGTRSKLTQGSMLGIKIPVPPLAEQKRIVDVVSSVDAYIGALQQQVDSARVARNAVLHELLSAGGDDWTETTLGEIAKWGSGGTPKSDNPSYYDGDIPWCVIGDLTEGEVSITEKCISHEGLRNSSAKMVEPGAVMIAMYGASIGRTGIVAVPMATNQAIAFAYVYEAKVVSQFLLIYLQIQKQKFIDAGQGAAQPNISQTVLKDWPILLPSLEEQNRIVGIVTSIDEVIQSTEQAIEDAKSLRSGLLTDLLSGNHEIPASYDSLLGAA